MNNNFNILHNLLILTMVETSMPELNISTTLYWTKKSLIIHSSILSTSICLYCQMPRNERFSSDHQFKLQTLIETITPYITSKYKDSPRETRNANFSVAYFVKVGSALLLWLWHSFRSQCIVLVLHLYLYLSWW